METDFIDGNTLKIGLSGRVGDEAAFTLTDATLGGERHFTIKITADAVEPTTDVMIIKPMGVSTPEVVNVSEVCEPITLSSELKLHIPVLKFTPIPNQTSIIYWADLKYTDNLQFEVIEFGPVEKVIETCESATLSSEFNLRIPTLQYTPSPGKTPWTMQADLKFIAGGSLLFEVIKYSLIVSQ
ncbi:hypothetical protein [Candidatus Parabeggiatoa sp. HSG14]|uniref:hypothetical protein n=1 Tax=Candidatus Parabeggiatoa sp. HSG14 TaxID=3055593 RepID=UPI0032E51E98